jgi:hypothetical protein
MSIPHTKKGVLNERGAAVSQAGLANPGSDHRPFSDYLLESKKIENLVNQKRKIMK